MLRNYWKSAFRNLIKNPGFSSISVIGLAVGMACCMLISLFVIDELSYDRYHNDADRIFRVQTDVDVAGSMLHLATTSFPMAEALKEDYSEIEVAARLAKWGEPVLSVGDRRLKEKALLWADPAIFQIFSWAWVDGDPGTALRDPNTIVLTESGARKYFGEEPPVGRTIRYENQRDLRVTGLLRDLPAASQIQFDGLASAVTLNDIMGRETLAIWHAFYPTQTFVRLHDSRQAMDLTFKLSGFVAKYLQDDVAKELGRTYQMSLLPLTDIHLSPSRRGEFGAVGSMTYLYTFSAIAVCILLIACINFINLSTARSSRRAKEVGLRKVVGASRAQLIRQFLGETMVIGVMALILSVVLVEMALPIFNELAGKRLTFDIWSGRYVLPMMGLIVVLVAVGAGLYPAVYLSRVPPIRSLKNIAASSRNGLWLRRGLVSIQFAVSIILIVSTVTVYRQLAFMRQEDLGLDEHRVIVVSASDALLGGKYDVLREALLQRPEIQNAAASTFVPGGKIMGTPVRKIPSSELEKWEMTTIPADHHFLSTLGIPLLAGRSFDTQRPTDMKEAVLINESAARTLGWVHPADAVGHQLEWAGLSTPIPLTIVGVMKDFNYLSLHQPIGPLIVVPITFWPNGYNYITVRMSSEEIQPALEALQSTWARIFPETPLTYSLLEDDFGRLYVSEDHMGRIVLVFTGMAILIACLGLLGLASFMAETRTKEMGIRKVVGASVTSLVRLMSKEYAYLIMVSNVIAWPVAYVLLDRWLSDFAYRVSMNIFTFAGATAMTILVAQLTVTYQAVKAATVNPVNSLKYE